MVEVLVEGKPMAGDPGGRQTLSWGFLSEAVPLFLDSGSIHNNVYAIHRSRGSWSCIMSRKVFH